MSVLAYHYFARNYIQAMTFAWSRDQRLYCVRDDGKVVGMTFHKDQEVVGWTDWDTDGLFKDTGSLRTIQKGEGDGVYFIVKRKINGNFVHYWEKYDQVDVADARDAFYVDCGLSYDNPQTVTLSNSGGNALFTSTAHGLVVNDEIDFADFVWETQYDANDTASQPAQLNNLRFFVKTVPTANTFTVSTTLGGTTLTFPTVASVTDGVFRKAVSSVSGLWHLEGKAVKILADGNVFSGTVASGAIAAINGSTKYSRIHIGLKYVTDVELLDITSGQGVVQGRSMTVTRVTLQLENSRFPKVSNSEGTLQLALPDTSELPTGIELYTGQAHVTIGSQWNWHGRVLLRHSDPTPFNLLYVAPEIQFDDAS